jgi:hypothetical protein
MIAAVNGLRKVLPNMGKHTDASRGMLFWTSTTDSGYANGTTAANASFRFSGSHGEVPSQPRTSSEVVRCVAGTNDATSLAALSATSLQKLWGSGGPRSDNTVNFSDPTAVAARSKVSVAAEAFDASNTLPSKIRLVPDPLYDSDGRFLNGSPGPAPRANFLQVVACGSGDTAPCRPSVTCGSQGGIDARIADCAAKNGARAFWDGTKYGQANEGTWSLVTVTTRYGVTWEVWRDDSTLLLWSDSARHYGPDNLRATADDVGSYYNWYQASGYSCSGAGCPAGGSSVSLTGSEGAAGAGTSCAGAPCQPSVPISLCADATLLAGLNGVSTYATPDLTHAKGNLDRQSSPKVLWRLPTQKDFYLALAHGARQVLPNADFSFWSATSGANSRSGALRFAMTNGYSDATDRTTATFTARCIGAVMP